MILPVKEKKTHSRRHPLVSICVPVFNGEAFLRQAVTSILEQTWTNIELIVVDNASTDSTREIMQMFSDSRLHVMRNERNIGPINNFNRCLALARGDYVKLVCADDILYPSCVEMQMAAWDSSFRDKIVLVNCGRSVIDASGRSWMVRNYGDERGCVAGKEVMRRTLRSGGNRIGEPTATMLRADVVRRVGGFRSGYAFCMDLDLWCRMLLEGDMYAIPDPLCAFRVASGSWSLGIARSQAREYRSLIDSLRSDGRFGLSTVDCLVSKSNGWLSGLRRRLFYKMLSVCGNIRPS